MVSLWSHRFEFSGTRAPLTATQLNGFYPVSSINTLKLAPQAR
jgi:hypothetical protein